MFHQKNPKRLTVALLFFLAIIIIGLITVRKPAYTFKASSGEMIESILSMADEITPRRSIILC